MLKKKLWSAIFVLCMILAVMTVSAFAAEDAPQLVDGYYEIYTADQLYWFAEQVNSGNTSINGKLMADIVVNENVLNADGTLNGDGSNFRVWTPIGNYDYQYIGTFDGNGKTVSGLYVNDTTKNYLGLIGYVWTGGVVKNLSVVDSYFYGGNSIGGVVGYNGGTVSGCYNTGTVSGIYNTGGVVGYARGVVDNCYNAGNVSSVYDAGGVVGFNQAGTVSNCNNSGTVSGGDSAGGVAGTNSGEAGTIRNCYNTGGVSGNDIVAGVVGYNYEGTVADCHNDGDISGGWYVGGVVGQNNGTISECHNTGSVSGSNRVGGVAGYNDGTVSNCYYIEGCASKNNGYGTSKTAQQFASGEVAYLLQGDQTEQVWGQKIGTEDYPVLGGEEVYLKDGTYLNRSHTWADATCTTPKTCSVCGETEGEALGHSYGNGFCARCGVYESAVLNGDVYEISNAGQLYWFSEQVSSGNTSINGKLMADIVVNDNVLNADGTLNGDGSNFRVWAPIGVVSYNGDSSTTAFPYAGTFDGNSKTVSGLYFNDASKIIVGLFGTVSSGGKVQNVGVVDSYLCAYGFVGGMVGEIYEGGIVSNCYNTGSVSGIKEVGGVIGYNTSGIVTNCYNTGSVSGSDRVGGVVGENFVSGIVSNSYNTGNVSGNGEYIGGVVGYNNYATVRNCYYLSGSVSGDNGAGQSMTAQQFASGEVAYLLQGSQIEQIWGQFVGAEPYPVLGGEKVYAGDGSYYNLCDHYWDGGCVEAMNCLFCGAVSSYLPGHQWQEATCDQPKTCTVCGTTEGNPLGHSYEGVVTEPDCTHAGFTTYTCAACGDSYQGDFVDPLGHETYSYSFVDGVHKLTCSLCGVTGNMTSTDGKQYKFNTAAPTLSVDIVMNIAVTLPAGFSDPYMVVEFNGTTATLNDYTINTENGRYVFAFPGINPQVMGDTFVATLYADVDGVQVTVELEYSMLKYINSQLKKSTISDALRTALSDLVMYGEANQVYEGYKTDALLSSLLEDAAKENLTPSTFANLDAGYNQMAITGTAHSSIDLKGVTMALGSKVIVRMTVYCAGPSAYTVKVTINGEDHLYPVSKLPLAAGYTDRYVLEFDQIRATQFGEVITFSFLDADGNQLGRTLTYSVYTYVQKNQGSANANLANLLKAIYNYGESVKNI